MNKITLLSSLTILLFINNPVNANENNTNKNHSHSTQIDDYYISHPQKNKKFLIEQNAEFNKKMSETHIDSDHLNDLDDSLNDLPTDTKESN